MFHAEKQTCGMGDGLRRGVDSAIRDLIRRSNLLELHFVSAHDAAPEMIVPPAQTVPRI